MSSIEPINETELRVEKTLLDLLPIYEEQGILGKPFDSGAALKDVKTDTFMSDCFSDLLGTNNLIDSTNLGNKIEENTFEFMKKNIMPSLNNLEDSLNPEEFNGPSLSFSSVDSMLITDTPEYQPNKPSLQFTDYKDIPSFEDSQGNGGGSISFEPIAQDEVFPSDVQIMPPVPEAIVPPPVPGIDCPLDGPYKHSGEYKKIHPPIKIEVPTNKFKSSMSDFPVFEMKKDDLLIEDDVTTKFTIGNEKIGISLEYHHHGPKEIRPKYRKDKKPWYKKIF